MPAAERSVITEPSSDPKGERDTHTIFVRGGSKIGKQKNPNFFSSENLRLTALLRDGR